MRAASLSLVLLLAGCGPDRRRGGGEDLDGVPDAAPSSLGDATVDVDDDALPGQDAGAGERFDGAPNDVDGCSGRYALEHVQGNGAAVVANNWSWATLAARVLCAGVPVAGVAVTWEVLEGTSAVSETAQSAPALSLEVATDAEGLSRIVCRHPSGMAQPSASNQPGLVRASVEGGASVDYIVTTFNPGGAAPLMPQARILVPENGGNWTDLGEATAGSTLMGGVQVAVANSTGAYAGQAVADIGVRVIPETPGAVRCVGDTVLTNADGIATCDLEIVGPAGPQSFDLEVGAGLLAWQDLQITIVE